ncbi:queuine tRNA-ribosyltransferase accessory subunit 2-like isoform X1 [Biomphalaria glabrata]|uniref:Queuine tRNA-ribosyltransferase accessory subunit 2 n=2 Tax=Biomphalaria glabrata TaxID=6526 RepID=A0A9W3B9P4_BIOGL|nr:queuine tRNA-ribosyltransferase accessory subunit 2-like isoform X1 [Biomphalaria glabrata]
MLATSFFGSIKMKFIIEKTLATGGRLGIISQANRQGNVTLETPMCTLFTKGGSAPHLSIDMLRRVAHVPEVAVMSLGALADHHETVAEFGKGLREFTAMSNPVIFTTLHDASAAISPGKNDNSGVAVWGKGGKIKLDTSLFMKIQESFCPDWFQAMSDGDTDVSCGNKRLVKSVDRTLDFLDEIVEAKNKSEVLSKSSLIGVIEGGFSETQRKRSAAETVARPVDGFLIEGFEKGNRDVDLFSLPDFTKILSFTLEHLPTDKPRIMETVWSPLQVIKAFKLGVDVFSSAYPHILTEKGLALVSDYSLPPLSQPAKLELQTANAKNEETNGLYIDLHNSRYSEDFGSILPGCSCYACTNFTRAYIHHLLKTKELLAFVLLTIHNFHQYFEFFQHLRLSLKSDRLNELEDYLSQQLNSGLDR